MTESTTTHTPLRGATEDLGWHLGVLLRAYHVSVEPTLDELPHGIRGYQVLSAVAVGDQQSQLALAAHLGIDRTVMTYLIDDLVGAGLVERKPHPTDRRARQIVTTTRGAATLATLQRRVREAEDTLFASLAPPDRLTVRELLRRVACDLKDVDAGDPCSVVRDTLGR